MVDTPSTYAATPYRPASSSGRCAPALRAARAGRASAGAGRAAPAPAAATPAQTDAARAARLLRFGGDRSNPIE